MSRTDVFTPRAMLIDGRLKGFFNLPFPHYTFAWSKLNPALPVNDEPDVLFFRSRKVVSSVAYLTEDTEYDYLSHSLTDLSMMSEALLSLFDKYGVAFRPEIVGDKLTYQFDEKSVHFADGMSHSLYLVDERSSKEIEQAVCMFLLSWCDVNVRNCNVNFSYWEGQFVSNFFSTPGFLTAWKDIVGDMTQYEMMKYALRLRGESVPSKEDQEQLGEKLQKYGYHRIYFDFYHNK
jgi:hypothetical protein